MSKNWLVQKSGAGSANAMEKKIEVQNSCSTSHAAPLARKLFKELLLCQKPLHKYHFTGLAVSRIFRVGLNI